MNAIEEINRMVKQKVVNILAAGAGSYVMHRLGRTVIGEKKASAVKQAQYEDLYGNPFARLAQMRAMRLAGKSAVGAARSTGGFVAEHLPDVAAQMIMPNGFAINSAASAAGLPNARDLIRSFVATGADVVGNGFNKYIANPVRGFIDRGISGAEKSMVGSGEISMDDLGRFNGRQTVVDRVAGPAMQTAIESFGYGFGPAVSLGAAGINLATNAINEDTARRERIKRQNIEDFKNAQPSSGNGDFWPSGAPKRQGDTADPHATAHSPMSLRSYGK